MTSLPPTLPNELWLIVTSYLSNEQLAPCYGTNRFFSEVALDAIYAHHRLFGKRTMSLERMIEYLTHVSQPCILQRITTLEIDASQALLYDAALPDDPDRTGTSSTQTTSAVSSRLWTPDEVALSKRVFVLARDFVLSLPNLHSIIFRDSEDGKPCPLFYGVSSHLWTHYVNNPLSMKIRRLTFDGPTINFNQVFPTLPHSPRALYLLESLSFTIQDDPRFTPFDEADPLRQFLDVLAQNGGRSQLSSLSVHIRTNEPQTNILSGILDSLSSQYSLTQLKRMSITAPSNIMEFGSMVVSKFLDLYRQQITHLRIAPGHSTRPAFYGQLAGPPFSGHVPGTMEALEHFEMRFIEEDAYWASLAIKVWILNSTQRLKSLDLNDGSCPFLFDDVRTFLHAFIALDMSRLNPFCTASIRTMSLHFLSLTPTHLAYLSWSIPNLRELHLRIFAPQYPLRNYLNGSEPELGDLEEDYFLFDEDARMEEEDQFVEDLEVREFDDWKLRYMSINLKDAEGRTINRLKDALRAKIPSLESLVVGNGIDEESSAF